MLDIMCDLESMGTQPDSAIVGIGLVEFDLSKGLIGNTFFRSVNLDDALAQVRHLIKIRESVKGKKA